MDKSSVDRSDLIIEDTALDILDASNELALFLARAVIDESKDSTSRITPHLGTWKGHSVTERSSVYGATEAEAETVTLLDFDENGQLIQDQTSTYKDKDAPSNVRWTGTVSDNLVTYDGGYQITLLPGGIYMGCPCDVGKHVADTKSYHLEFCWLESPTKRQRLVRTYDVDGLAVSSNLLSRDKSVISF